MGVYGSPQLGIYTEHNKENKHKKLSNPILIIIDAIVFLFACLLIESLTLLEYGDLLSIVFLLTFGLIIGLTVGLFGKIRKRVSNRTLMLFLSIILIITPIIGLLVD